MENSIFQKKVLLYFFILIICNIKVFSQSSVRIGSQVWTTTNLDVTEFQNGDKILQAKSIDEWVSAWKNKIPAWRFNQFDSSKAAYAGKCYNWYAVMDKRGLAPTGWHIPSDAEWTILINYLGGIKLASFKLKAASGWCCNGNGNNASGFNAIPFPLFGMTLRLWSTTERDENSVWGLHISSDNSFSDRVSFEKHYDMIYVRCIKD